MESNPDGGDRIIRFQDGAVVPAPECISEHVQKALTKYFGGPFNLFEMQGLVISHLIFCAVEVPRPGDIVLLSPTGSGKTLAFAVPIVERMLRVGAVPHLRAIVVVPTHDLAVQVASVFKALLEGTDIKVAVATGGTTVRSQVEAVTSAQILVATPGRLADHVENTPDVFLDRVDFLVIDESDRILADAFDSWIDIVMPKCGVPKEGDKWPIGTRALMLPAVRKLHPFSSSTRKILVSATATCNPQYIAKLNLRGIIYFEPVLSKQAEERASASGKQLPADKKFSVPRSLKEMAYVLESVQQKPMALLSMLGWRTGVDMAETEANTNLVPLSPSGSKLIFTKSVPSAHRLARLLELFAGEQSPSPLILVISRDVAPERRRVVLSLLKESAASDGSKPARPVIVVCSDVFARGMDIPSVEAVISYDYPPQSRMYLHRVGRTARAGRSGTAITVLLANQVHHFKEMVREIDRGDKKCKFRDVRIDRKRNSQLEVLLEKRLLSLKRILRREALGLLVAGECVPDHMLAEMTTDDAAVLSRHAAREKLRRERENQRGAVDNDAKVDTNGDGHKATFDEAADYEENEDMGYVDEEADAESDDLRDGESDLEEDSDLDEDNFEDLLRSQVAKNWLHV